MLNILYCLDENYNSQAFSSIISVLDSSSSKLNFFIIHKNPETMGNLPKKISQHINLNEIKILHFKADNKYFPNVENAHVSEATYYRLYIESLLPEDLEDILYLDCDVICINDPIKEVLNISKTLKNSEKVIAVKTEFTKDSSNKKFFEDLDVNLKQYFNAGVMYIDLDKWRNINVEKKSLSILNDRKEGLKYWDQDVLNILFNGEYLELDERLNFKIGGDKLYSKELKLSDKEIFLHYMGSKKPWTIEGLLDINSKYYQLNYMKIYKKNYHIVNKWRKYSLYLFIKNTLNLKLIINTKYIIMMKSYLKSLF